MPVDTRRVNGPDCSTSYLDFVEKSAQKSDLSSIKCGRSDKRKSDQEHRPLFLKTGIITKAKGSAYIEQGQTKAICAVYGPREIPRRSDFSMRGILNCTLEHTPYARKRRKAPGAQKDELEQEMSTSLGQALEATVCMHLYPKSQIDVYVTILEDDGCTLAAALTVSGLALADAAIQMFDTLVGASVLRCNERVVIDPTRIEESESDELQNPPSSSSFAGSRSRSFGQITLGYQPSLEQIALMSQEGHMTTDHLMEDTKRLTKVCTDLVSNVQMCLVESVKSSNSSSTNESESQTSGIK